MREQSFNVAAAEAGYGALFRMVILQHPIFFVLCVDQNRRIGFLR